MTETSDQPASAAPGRHPEPPGASGSWAKVARLMAEVADDDAQRGLTADERVRVALLRAAARYVNADLAARDGQGRHAGDELDYAGDLLAHAARDLTAATDALPADRQPVGWVAGGVEDQQVSPAAPARLARVEVKGFRDLGVVAVSESTLAGEAMLRCEARDGSVSEFPASSVHFITWLPAGAGWPGGKPRQALTSGALLAHGGWGEGWEPDEEDDDPWAHSANCDDWRNCDGSCAAVADMPF